jgi:hypothetical protein
MNAELKLNEILSQVKKLNKLDQATLLKKISVIVQNKDKAGKQVKLSEISGLGASLWHSVNIDRYIDDERQW